MPLRSIVVHFENSETGTTRLQLAVNLAEAHGAHLIGLSIGAENLSGENSDQETNEFTAALLDMASSSNLSHEWHCVTGNPVEALTRYARCSDLTVIGQRNYDLNSSKWPLDLADRLILLAGRPVLVVPYVGSFPTLGKRIIVAWDGSKSASRALYDALPLLAKAKKVSLLTIMPKGMTEQSYGNIPSADICKQLARHGIQAEAYQTPSGDLDPGDALLSRSSDAGADLIVMGAYGHNRLHELMLGGVTHKILEHMTTPVLMSH